MGWNPSLQLTSVEPGFQATKSCLLATQNKVVLLD